MGQTDDIIQVDSPGKPVPEISLEELNSFSAPSIRRNPTITYVFSLMDYVEEKGFGMDAFKSIRDKYGYPLPKYSFKKPFLSLSFPRNAVGAGNLVGMNEKKQLSEEELKALETFRTNKEISKSKFVMLTGMKQRSAERLLKDWTDSGLIS